MTLEPFGVEITVPIEDGNHPLRQTFAVEGFWFPRTLTEGPQVVRLASVVPLDGRGGVSARSTPAYCAGFLRAHGGALLRALEREWRPCDVECTVYLQEISNTPPLLRVLVSVDRNPTGGPREVAVTLCACASPSAPEGWGWFVDDVHVDEGLMVSPEELPAFLGLVVLAANRDPEVRNALALLGWSSPEVPETFCVEFPVEDPAASGWFAEHTVEGTWWPPVREGERVTQMARLGEITHVDAWDKYGNDVGPLNEGERLAFRDDHREALLAILVAELG